jgi:hypothetical protein
MGLLDSFKKKTNKSEAFGKINSGNFTMTRQTSNIQFAEDEIDKVFQTLTSADIALKNSFEDYLKEEYKGDDAARLDYFDIAEIGRQIVAKLKRGQTEDFQLFFDKVEEILQSCDSRIENLIVVGLFEGIQNIGGREINYYSDFDKWLKPTSNLSGIF